MEDESELEKGTEKEAESETSWGSRFKQWILYILLVFAFFFGKTWWNSQTASNPKILKVDRDSVKMHTIALTDAVNVYRELNIFNTNVPNIISFGLVGMVTSRNNPDYALYVNMMVHSKSIIKINKDDRLLLMMADSTIVPLNVSDGLIKSSRGGRRSLPNTEQVVIMDNIRKSLLDSICRQQIVKMSFVSATDTCTVLVRKGSSKKLLKRYNFLEEFIQTEGKQWEKKALIESTKTKDPNIVRFAKMTPVWLDEKTSVKIKGYIDKDGTKGFVWELFIRRKEKAMSFVKVQNNITIRLHNGKTLHTYAYSDGHILRRRSNGERVQAVACRITASQMEEICQGRLSELEILTPKKPYRIIVSQSATDKLAKRYRVLQNYLQSKND